jgi:hypothetical protein
MSDLECSSEQRVGIAMQANRFARVCYEEALKYASKRKTFGVLLRDHPVIRNKVSFPSFFTQLGRFRSIRFSPSFREFVCIQLCIQRFGY